MSDSIQNIYKANSAAVVVVLAIALLALFAGSRRRGGGATTLGILGVLLSLPSAIYVGLQQFEIWRPEYNEDQEWINAGLNSASIVGLAFILLALIIAKSPVQRQQFQQPPPQYQQPPPRPW
ncbi:hypothetical protein [Antrihabitans spumae]|uniref:Uncharacterized protein n=1 Tax=Antrihabitans spumae TaxID=3373370 RepID=A0ABW7KJJ3_9NOCA